MIWQDLIFAVGGFGFSAALLPTVLKKTKVPRETSFITGLILTLYLLAYSTLGLWLGFGAGVLTAGMWWYLFFIGRSK